MTKYLAYQLEDGETVFVEVEEASISGLVPAGRGEEDLIQKADRRFEDAVDSARTAANILLHKLKSLPERPDEIEVTFGLTASGELGGNFFFAKAGLEANYLVKMTWKKDKATDTENSLK